MPNAYDDRDCLAVIDRWLTDNIEVGLREAITQQQWPADTQEQIRAAWYPMTTRNGFIYRGHGWRVWCANGDIYNSSDNAWEDVPGEDQIVLGVSYCGPMRWMSQGLAPYWTNEGYLYDGRATKHLFPEPYGIEKRGAWVTDEVMREARLKAVLAFTL